MKIPEDLASILQGGAVLDSEEQAFVFLTVDAAGFPHPALLSRAELGVSNDRVLAVVASVRTQNNLRRDGRAGLVAVEGTVAHYAKLRVVSSVEDAGVLGGCFELIEHKRDSLAIPLAPITFRATQDIARLERWELSARVLDALGEASAGRDESTSSAIG